ncbi:MAG: hypothetical protein KDK08_13740, partial [Rhizobiaceae bacterium]|nr:hypothetical protein [Rhizobiaceae bacterium]
ARLRQIECLGIVDLLGGIGHFILPSKGAGAWPRAPSIILVKGRGKRAEPGPSASRQAIRKTGQVIRIAVAKSASLVMAGAFSGGLPENKGAYRACEVAAVAKSHAAPKK